MAERVGERLAVLVSAAPESSRTGVRRHKSKRAERDAQPWSEFREAYALADALLIDRNSLTFSRRICGKVLSR